MKKASLFLCCFCFAFCAYAQERLISLNLKQKENRFFMNSGVELPRLLLEAAEAGKLKPYRLTSIPTLQESELSPSELRKRLEIDSMQWVFPQDVSILDIVNTGGGNKSIYLSLYIPADLVNEEKNRYVASFRYEDCKKILDADCRAIGAYGDAIAFGHVFRLDEIRDTHLKLISQLLKSAEDGKSTAYDKTTEKSMSFAELKTKININDAQSWRFKLRLKEKKDVQGCYLPETIDIVDTGTDKNDYKVSYLASFKISDLIASQPDTLMKFTDALQSERYKASDLFPTSGKTTSETPENKSNRYGQWIASELDLREEGNKNFAANNKEIARLLLAAAAKNKLVPYRITEERYTVQCDLQTIEMTEQELQEALAVPTTTIVNTPSNIITIEIGKKRDRLFKAYAPGNYFSPAQLTTVELRELMTYTAGGLFKKYETMYIGIIIPGGLSPSGLDKSVAYFKWRDCKKILRKKYKSALYGKRLSLYEGILLRDFESSVWKTEENVMSR